jgi:hypothetical protein
MRLITALLFTLAIAGSGFAQPANDACTAATPIGSPPLHGDGRHLDGDERRG